MRNTAVALFYALAFGLFAAFAAGGVVSLPIFGKVSAEIAFAARFDSAETHLREAVAALERARAASSPEVAAQEHEQSLRLAEQSLALRPLNPRAWLVRAQANYLLGSDAPARADWQRSLERGPYERRIAVARADLGIRLWHHLDAAQKEHLLAQIRWTWQATPGEVVRLARLSANHELLIRRALASDPATLERLERRLETTA